MVAKLAPPAIIPLFEQWFSLWIWGCQGEVLNMNKILIHNLMNRTGLFHVSPHQLFLIKFKMHQKLFHILNCWKNNVSILETSINLVLKIMKYKLGLKVATETSKIYPLRVELNTVNHSAHLWFNVHRKKKCSQTRFYDDHRKIWRRMPSVEKWYFLHTLLNNIYINIYKKYHQQSINVKNSRLNR